MLEISDMIVLFLDRYLRREPEVGVDLDLRGPVRSARQRLHIRLEHVLAQGDPHLQPHSQSHPLLGSKELGTWNLERISCELTWFGRARATQWPAVTTCHWLTRLPPHLKILFVICEENISSVMIERKLGSSTNCSLPRH